VDVLGLDLDHTLAVYDDAAVNALAFRETCRNMVDIKGYPAFFADLDYRDTPAVRGLIADAAGGYLVKLDHCDRIRRAYGPDGFVTANIIATTYGELPLGVDGYYQIQSPFDLPAGALFAASLGLSPPSQRLGGAESLHDIVEMLDRSHRLGNLKRTIVSDPGRFIERRSGLDRLIARFREDGKKTVLLTNSGYDYTVEVLDHLFPGDRNHRGWRGLFDAVVVDAAKPKFFDPAAADPPHGLDVNDGVRGTVWRAGDAGTLERHFDAAPERILYIGDNPAADCLAARGRGWRTALVVPEIETDPRPPHAFQDHPSAHTEPWGSLFWEAGQPTRFARVLRKMPDVFAARIEQILAPGPAAKFQVE
jgi:HAD superfamily 5'-nucleotidase-like hydrolase